MAVLGAACDVLTSLDGLTGAVIKLSSGDRTGRVRAETFISAGPVCAACRDREASPQNVPGLDLATLRVALSLPDPRRRAP